LTMEGGKKEGAQGKKKKQPLWPERTGPVVSCTERKGGRGLHLGEKKGKKRKGRKALAQSYRGPLGDRVSGGRGAVTLPRREERKFGDRPEKKKKKGCGFQNHGLQAKGGGGKKKRTRRRGGKKRKKR